MATAQTKPAVDHRAGAHLRLVVILSRHGVRSPTWSQERLDKYSIQPWPEWSVPPGVLTGHGYELLKRLGSYDRTIFATSGLMTAVGCADAAKMYIWADTDQRTVASGHALAEGIFPGCPPAVHALSNGQNDLLFHPAEGRAKSGMDAAANPSFYKTGDMLQTELLKEMQHVLSDCPPQEACKPARVPQVTLHAEEMSEDSGSRELQKALPLASSFSEDFLLEYAEGMPMDQVGWGRVNESQVRRFLALHTRYFDLAHRTPTIARLEASNMLHHIEQTLLQRVSGRKLPDAIGPTDGKVVVLVGHDTNIAGVAGLLNVHWTLDVRSDDTPPGTELAFELWEDAHGHYSVRVKMAMQTLLQMRESVELNAVTPPAHADLAMPGCHDRDGACSWGEFRRAVEQSIDRSAVVVSDAIR